MARATSSGMRRRGSRTAATLLLAAAWCRWGLSGDSAFLSAAHRGARQQPAAGRIAVVAIPQRQLSVARRFFDNPFAAPPEPPAPPVVIKEDYTLAAIFGALGVVLCAALPYAGFGLGALILLLAVLFYVQAGRVRFVFDNEAFELRTLGDGSDELESPGENIVVGGKNRWKYSSFVNWEFFPKGLVEQGLPPILVYFKETQTPKEEWDVGPGAQANSEEALAKGAQPGMVHFFPAICDTRQIKEEFERRGCAKISSE